MDLPTNGVVINDVIRFVEQSKDKLISKKDDDKESKEPDYDYNEDIESEEKQEEETN